MDHTDSIGRDLEHMKRCRLGTLVRDLTQPDRVLLEWRMVDGWCYDTIAIRLGVPQADLVNRVRRIRMELRRRAKALVLGETKLDMAPTMIV